MTTAATAGVLTGRWMSGDELRALGFAPSGPEIDYGMGWGEGHDVRVSLAPQADRGGFLYAHDRTADRYMLLAAHTTAEQVEAAWQELIACAPCPDAFLAFTALSDAAMPVDQARQLLLDCVEREMAAHQDFIASGVDAPVRVDAAYGVVVQRSARIAAEDLQIDAVRAANPDDDPVIIRYRVLGDSRWTGRVAGADLNSATGEAQQLETVANHHQLTLQATSVSQGHTTVAAARVPELGTLARHADIATGGPCIGI
jgi:hypothetical protein